MSTKTNRRGGAKAGLSASARILFLISPTFRENIRRSKRATKKLKKTTTRLVKTTRRLVKAIDVVLVPLVKAHALDEIRFILRKIDARQLRQLGRSRIMGMCRLFLLDNDVEAVSKLLSIYMGREHPYDALYFFEPLKHLTALDRKDLVHPDLEVVFECSASILDWLGQIYLPADDLDLQNFNRLILDPLRLVESDSHNLMQIRFSEDQQKLLRSKITKRVSENMPLSLVRLGDGEAYAYPPPPAAGLDQHIFEKDSQNFELRTWGQSPPPRGLADRYKARFREAIAAADIVGIPSAYRVIRNLPPPYTRYGNRRHQRALMRILFALGRDIPLEGKLFTEERCQRISGAIDENFLFDLAKTAKKVVLISCYEDIANRFHFCEPILILIPSDISEFIRDYLSTVDRIRSFCEAGTLVIIGAGQIGKILANEARQTGAVALDVGSLLDYMVGLKTRTIADLV